MFLCPACINPGPSKYDIEILQEVKRINEKRHETEVATVQMLGYLQAKVTMLENHHMYSLAPVQELPIK